MKTIQLLAAVAAIGGALVANAAVPTSVTYQGRVQVSGANFSGTGQFKFALVDPGSNAVRQATAVATVTSGFITGIAVIDGGVGYNSPPAVTITDSTGSGATAVASVSGGAVTGINVQLTGGGYSASPAVTVAPPPPNLIYATHWSNDGSSAAGSEPAAAINLPVAGGLFTALLGDVTLANMTSIPPDVLTNRDVRLRIWFNDGANGFAALSPDQPLTSAPYALHALNASAITGPVPASSLAGTIAPANLADGSIAASKLAANSVTTDKIADGSILGTDLNLDLLEMTFWRVGGNTGTTPGTHFLGTTDNQPLEFKVNDQAALRLLPTTNGYPNLIGGVSNAVGTDVRGATVAGGFLHTLGNGANAPTIGGGFLNYIQDGAATISGGAYNTNTGGANYSTIGGGGYQRIQAAYSTVAGGFINSIRQGASYSTIGGGDSNTAQTNATYATISGGGFNVIGVNADYATVPGGALNQAGGDFSFAAGFRAKANHQGAFVLADSQNADFASTTSNQFNVRASGGVRLETGGAAVTVDGQPVVAGQVGAAQIADGGITAAKLAAGSVTSANLADGAVTLEKLNRTTVISGVVTLTNPTPSNTEYFGISAASVGNDKFVVGAYLAFGSVSSSGEAYVYDPSGALLTTLTNPTPAVNDEFGYAVAGVGPDNVLIGAPGDDAGANASGVAYLLTTGGALVTTFTNPTPAVDDRFGTAVAGVGQDKVLISAVGDDVGANNSGVAHLFNTNGTLLLTFTNPGPSADDRFGYSVTAVGHNAFLIGAFLGDEGGGNAGGAYLYASDGTLMKTFSNPTPAAADSFGTAIAALGTDRVLIGAYSDGVGAPLAGVVYLFSTNGTLLTTFTNPAPASNDRFGSAVAPLGTGRVLISALLDDATGANSGTAYLFDTNGTLLATFANPTPANDDFFGSAIASVGNDRVLIGASQDGAGAIRAGAAHIFSLAQQMPGLVAGGVADGAITTESLANGTVTDSKLGDGAVTAAKLADGAALLDLADDDGAGSGLDADLLDGLDSSAFWQLAGNSGTSPGTHFLGTSDNQSLELKVNNVRALRLEPTATTPNLIGGYSGNSAAAGVDGGVIGGGGSSGGANQIAADYTTIGGGLAHGIQTTAHYATISGGRQSTIQTNAQYSAIGGGYLNTVSVDSLYSVVDGGYRNLIHTNSSYAVIGGGRDNTNGPVAHYSTISGGYGNTILSNAQASVIAGGIGNTVSNDSQYSTISGGYSNRIFAAAFYSTIAGGTANTNGHGAHYSAIGGGWQNDVRSNAQSSVVAGGYRNVISNNSSYCVIAGGQENRIDNAWYSTIAGGLANRASGWYSFAAGRRAKAIHEGAFVWGDSTDADIASTNANSMTFRASGGVRFFSNVGSAGVYLAPGGTSWGVISDRNAKKNFAPVNGREILEKLAALPVQQWNYKWETDNSVPHLGPMAQDFKAAFYPGRDDKTISTLEADGVALAAIQGLNKKTGTRTSSQGRGNRGTQTSGQRVEETRPKAGRAKKGGTIGASKTK